MKDSLTRRRLLRNAASVGGLAGLASLAGCMGDGTGGGSYQQQQAAAAASMGGPDMEAAIDRSTVEHRFDAVVDLVEDYGADPTGEEDITGELAIAWADDRLIVLPEGEYKMNKSFRRTGGSNVGLIGENAIICHGEVEAIYSHLVTEGEYGGGTMMFRIGTPTDPHQGDLLFGGFTFDWSWSENAGMQGLNTAVDGEAEIRNLRFHGMHSLGTHGNMRVAPQTSESLMFVSDVDMRHGGRHYRHTINSRETERRGQFPPTRPPPSWSTTALVGNPQSAGTTHINNVWVGGWPDNGIYIQGGTGRKIVTNCVAVNSNISNIRLDGGDDWEPHEYLDGENPEESDYAQSTVENCVVAVDKSPDPEWYRSQRGIWFREGDGVIRDCHVRIEDRAGPEYGPSSGSAIGMTMGVDDLEIKRCTIEMLTEGHAIFSNGVSGFSAEDVVIQTNGEPDPGRVISALGADLEGVTLNGKPLV